MKYKIGQKLYYIAPSNGFVRKAKVLAYYDKTRTYNVKVQNSCNEECNEFCLAASKSEALDVVLLRIKAYSDIINRYVDEFRGLSK